MPELLGICDRLLIMRKGRVAARLERSAFNMETIFAYAAGIRTEEVAA